MTKRLKDELETLSKWRAVIQDLPKEAASTPPTQEGWPTQSMIEAGAKVLYNEGAFPTTKQDDRVSRLVIEAALAAAPTPPGQIGHWSDCSIHNAPAMIPGDCDCGGNAPEAPDNLNVMNDREMLNYLNNAFENEVSYCGRCGHGDPTKTCDSASILKNYLCANPAPKVQDGGCIYQFESGEGWVDCDEEDFNFYDKNAVGVRKLYTSPTPPAQEDEPVAEIVCEDLGSPFNAAQIRAHFYSAVPPIGTKLYTRPADDKLRKAVGEHLAFVHRDGGHYRQKVGDIQAIEDATNVVLADRQQLIEMEKLRKVAEESLAILDKGGIECIRKARACLHDALLENRAALEGK